MGWTLVWVATLALRAVHAARVWIGSWKWGISLMLWIVRVVIFGSVALFLVGWMGTKPLDVLLSYANAIGSLPYVGDRLGKESPWPLVVVGAVFGSICFFLYTTIRETVADILSLIGKLLSFLYHGGILFADRRAPAKPVRWVGLEVVFVWRDLRRLRRGRKMQESARRRADKRLKRRPVHGSVSGTEPDGFTLFVVSAEPRATVSTTEPERVPVVAGTPIGSHPDGQTTPARSAELEPTPDPFAADKEEVESLVAPPADTRDRDADFALMSGASRDAESSSEAAALAVQREQEEGQDRSAEKLDRIYLEHQSTAGRAYAADLAEYTSREELLLDESDGEASFADDPFDPGFGDGSRFEVGSNPIADEEEEKESLPFGIAFRDDSESSEGAELSDPNGLDGHSEAAAPSDARPASGSSVGDPLDDGENEVAGGNAGVDDAPLLVREGGWNSKGGLHERELEEEVDLETNVDPAVHASSAGDGRSEATTAADERPPGVVDGDGKKPAGGEAWGPGLSPMPDGDYHAVRSHTVDEFNYVDEGGDQGSDAGDDELPGSTSVGGVAGEPGVAGEERPVGRSMESGVLGGVAASADGLVMVRDSLHSDARAVGTEVVQEGGEEVRVDVPSGDASAGSPAGSGDHVAASDGALTDAHRGSGEGAEDDSEELPNCRDQLVATAKRHVSELGDDRACSVSTLFPESAGTPHASGALRVARQAGVEDDFSSPAGAATAAGRMPVQGGSRDDPGTTGPDQESLANAEARALAEMRSYDDKIWEYALAAEEAKRRLAGRSEPLGPEFAGDGLVAISLPLERGVYLAPLGHASEFWFRS